jgi:hypothetical protein
MYANHVAEGSRISDKQAVRNGLLLMRGDQPTSCECPGCNSSKAIRMARI